MSESPFIHGTQLQYAWDSTSLGVFKECPRKYYFSIICGYRSKNTKLDLIFGIEYHHALETYDRCRSEGDDHDRATLRMVRDALIRTHDWKFDDPNKNRHNLIRSIIWYVEHYRNDNAHTIQLANGKPAVELSFSFATAFESDGNPFLLCGHIDRLVEFAGDVFVMDRKTTKNTIAGYYFDHFSPDNQMTLYTLASKIVWSAPVKGVLVDAVQVAVGFSAFERGTAFRTDGQLDEWMDELTHDFWPQAVDYARRGQWPGNDKSCRMCEFKKICSKDPQVRQTFLESEYNVEYWNPLARR